MSAIRNTMMRTSRFKKIIVSCLVVLGVASFSIVFLNSLRCRSLPRIRAALHGAVSLKITTTHTFGNSLRSKVLTDVHAISFLESLIDFEGSPYAFPYGEAISAGAPFVLETTSATGATERFNLVMNNTLHYGPRSDCVVELGSNRFLTRVMELMEFPTSTPDDQ